jgi:hypothetical protein
MTYLGLVCGVFCSVGGLVYDFLMIGLNRGTAMAFMALVGMPLIFGTVGFLFGALIAILSGVTRAVRLKVGSR